MKITHKVLRHDKPGSQSNRIVNVAVMNLVLCRLFPECVCVCVCVCMCFQMHKDDWTFKDYLNLLCQLLDSTESTPDKMSFLWRLISPMRRSFPQTTFNCLWRVFLLEASSLCQHGFRLPGTSWLWSLFYFYPGSQTHLAHDHHQAFGGSLQIRLQAKNNQLLQKEFSFFICFKCAFCTRHCDVGQEVVIVVVQLSCVRLFHDPMDYSPPGSSVHGIFQARVLEWVAISYSGRSS